MSTDQIKKEINVILDRLSNKSLAGLLSFLKATEESKTIDLSNSDDLQKIISEDKELLQKLAQ